MSSSTIPDDVDGNLNIEGGNVWEDKLGLESSPSGLEAKCIPVSITSSLETPALVDENSSQDIDPIVTLFDNAIMSTSGEVTALIYFPEPISKLAKAKNPATAKKTYSYSQIITFWSFSPSTP
ncbi:uncharacterized protein EAF01_000391 [Botrytis porri]|uniref:uncharacterized protein n=1 Tax=Botrytis porri TaxID=87229 RepID=UPI0018FF4C12|nr:uncharacterized protein EAF01_000391 [Botrytis porri]KAF7913985.1 hypothetical protein EAF01_000391 [Botrytis porri]